MGLISIPGSALQVAQQSALAATAELALAQIAATQAGEIAQDSAPKPAANPPGVGGLVDQTA
jgi:hypothetical protein